MDKNKKVKLLEEITDKPADYISEVAKKCEEYLKGKLMVAAAHTVVNLKNRLDVSEEAVESTDFAFGLMEKLNGRFSKVDFLIPLNDFFMEKDAGTDEGKENTYRKEALTPYVVPTELMKIFEKYGATLPKTDIYYCSEKNMADKFKRHIKNTKKKSDFIFENYGVNGENWRFVLKSGEKIDVILNNKPNCISGNAATFRDISETAKSNKVKENYNSHVAIYPLCSMNNVLNGYSVADEFYDLNLPTILIFFGKKCF